MNREAILNKYSNEEDRLFVAKIIDKINFAKTRNQIVATDFLDMYQKKIAQELEAAYKEEDRFYLKRRKYGCDHHVLYRSARPDPERQSLHCICSPS